MSSNQPFRVQPRSAIADAALARRAVTELPGTPISRNGLRPRAILRTARSLGRPVEPERVIVMPLPSIPAPSRSPLARHRR